MSGAGTFNTKSKSVKVLDGAPTDVLKPDLILPCFVLRPGQYRVVKDKNL
jgi:hypothetical protein